MLELDFCKFPFKLNESQVQITKETQHQNQYWDFLIDQQEAYC